MKIIQRALTSVIEAQLVRGKSVLLLGPRQTGKSTLVQNLKVDTSISLMQAELRHRYERSPQALRFEVEALARQLNKVPLVFIDEIQLVPELMNEVQVLIDQSQAQFVLSGSSARKLKHQNHINLLPGRVVLFHLAPLMEAEMQGLPYTLEDRLYFGSLPATVLESDLSHRETDLISYVEIYLEDEVRREALVRNLAQFGRFLELAAAQSGEIVNLVKLSQEIGVAHTTISNYYQILEDCLIVKRIDPFTEGKTRRRLIHSPRYLFFDLGVRRLAAKEGMPLPTTQLGRLFEQWVGLELLKRIGVSPTDRTQLFFWRDSSGVEVDWVLKQGNTLTPVEVKWTEHPQSQDIRQLRIFMEEYACTQGYLVCRTPYPIDMGSGVTALPWTELAKVYPNPQITE